MDEQKEMTQVEEEKILKGAFLSLVPLKLKQLPPKEKKKLVVLRKIAEQLDQERKYSEPEINELLLAIYTDYVTLRRGLIEYGFVDRTRDGKEYWVHRQQDA
ncbi:MAG: DUF2087 domain-containing protein [Clostridia bacterium]